MFMTDLRTLLSKEEKTMMSDYVTEFATERNPKHADIDYLLRSWNDAKGAYLYKLFGEKFQIKKTLVYNKPEDKLYDELQRKFNDWNSACYNFRRTFDRFLWENRITLGNDYYKLQLLTDVERLIKTAYEDDEFSVNTPDGRTIKVQKGCRPMRIISKVAKAYGGLPGLEEFQNEVSVILTQKKLTGEMTLSIHPMDFMTMSHNELGWSSCMDWTDQGCYRRGTIEMMNSTCVVVAYLAAENNDMSFYADGQSYTWNNKKWRELFIVTPEVITGVKGYPYQNSDLVKLVNSWLRELAEENLGWHYDKENVKYDHRTTFSHKHDNGEWADIRLNFETNTMYNDFGTIQHYAIIGSDLKSGTVYTNYSGDEMCMMCGSVDNCFDGEGALLCCDCDNSRCCDCCGDRISGDDIYELDGSYYCYSCYEDRSYYDVMDECDHDINNTTTLYLLPEDVDPADYNFGAWDSVKKDVYHTSGRVWRRWFNTTEASEYRLPGTWGNYRYYVKPSMFKDIEDIETIFDVSWEDYIPADPEEEDE